MQLVVKISEDTFFDLKKKQNRTEVDNAVLNGRPLPKGHGRLLDEKDILDTENNDGGWYDLTDMPEYIAGIKAIIEADKSESEEYGMTEIERKNMMIINNTIKGEINRMCVTNDLKELDAMALCAQGNIERLLSMRYNDFKEKVQIEKSCDNCNNYDKRNGCDGDYDYMCECTDNEYKHWKGE